MTIHVVFTGGGSAGHVNPNLALIDALESKGCRLDYIGSETGIEREMITKRRIPYHAIRSGKLRRYFSWQNFIDPFNLVIGCFQAYFLLYRLKPHVVFSKGGFVALPVVLGAWLHRIPVIAHESDLTPGLANRLSLAFIDTLCVTFSGSKAHIQDQTKIRVTGTPLRESLLQGSAQKGLSLCGFEQTKPCLLVIGGSQGAQVINRCIREMLQELTVNFQVIHLCGKGHLDKKLEHQSGYRQFEYAHEDLPHLFAASSLVISRAGANAIYEILALGKPHILVPLSRRSSRGDQIENARYFKQQGISLVIEEESLTPATLRTTLDQLLASAEQRIAKIRALEIKSATDTIVKLILDKASLSQEKA